MKGISFILTSVLYMLPIIFLIRGTYPKIRPKLKSLRQHFFYFSIVGMVTVGYLFFCGKLVEILPVDHFFGAVIFGINIFAIYLTCAFILVSTVLWILYFIKRLAGRH